MALKLTSQFTESTIIEYDLQQPNSPAIRWFKSALLTLSGSG